MFSAFDILSRIALSRPAAPAQRHTNDVTACVSFLRAGVMAPPAPAAVPADVTLRFAQFVNVHGTDDDLAALRTRLVQLAQVNLAPGLERQRATVLLDLAVHEFLPRVLAGLERHCSAHMAKKLPSLKTDTLATAAAAIDEFLSSRLAMLPARSIESPAHEVVAYTVIACLLSATYELQRAGNGALDEGLALDEVLSAFSAAPELVSPIPVLDSLLKIGAPAFPAPLDVLACDRLMKLAKFAKAPVPLPVPL